MGYTIYANGSSVSFDGGGGGFFNLRKNIALAFDKELGEHYATLAGCNDYEAFDKKTEAILSQKRFTKEDDDILDFLFACDCSGNISHKTCKKIYELIKDVDFGDKIFTYAAHSDGKDYERLKEFLLECWSHRRRLRWM